MRERERGREGLHSCIRRAGHAFSLSLSPSRFLSFLVDIVSRISDSGKMRLTLMRLHFSNRRRPYSLSLSLFVLHFPSSSFLLFFHRPAVSPANDACLECNRKSRKTSSLVLVDDTPENFADALYDARPYKHALRRASSSLGRARTCSRIHSGLVEIPLKITVSPLVNKSAKPTELIQRFWKLRRFETARERDTSLRRRGIGLDCLRTHCSVEEKSQIPSATSLSWPGSCLA